MTLNNASNKMDTSNMEATVIAAYHEVGHVVMALLWGVQPVNRVSIVRTDNSRARTDYSQITQSQFNKHMQRLGSRLNNALFERMIGGPVAQALFLQTTSEYQAGVIGSDFENIADVAQKLRPGINEEEIIGLIRGMEPAVFDTLRRMWPVVEALAKELLAKEELTHTEIESIMLAEIERMPEENKVWALSWLQARLS